MGGRLCLQQRDLVCDVCINITCTVLNKPNVHRRIPGTIKRLYMYCKDCE